MGSTVDVKALSRRVDAARATFNDGQPKRAARQYDVLRRRLSSTYPDVPGVGVQYSRVLLGLAAATYEVSGELDQAMTMLDEAELVADACRAAELAVTIRGQRGVLLLRAGRTADAHLALDRAAADLTVADTYDQMTILLNRGTLSMDSGRLRPAVEDFQRCVEIATRTGNRDLELRARHNLGYAEFLTGRIPRALAAMDRAARLRPGPAHPISLLDRARVLREAGLTRDADRLMGSAAELFAAGRLHQDVAETRLAQAECALTEGDLDRARRLAGAAERAFERRGNVQWRHRAQLLVLRCERLASDSSSRSATVLRSVADRAARLAEESRNQGRHDLARPAELLELECRLRAGEGALAGRKMPVVRAGDSLQARLQILEVRALAAAQRGDRVAAAAEVRKGLTELGSYQNRFGSLDLRTASAVHGLPLARLGLDLAMQSGSAAQVFAAVERHRAFSTRLASVAPPTDERTADLLAALRHIEEDVRSLEGVPAAADAAAVLRGRARGLQRDIRARAWELEGDAGTTARRSPRLGEVREASRSAGLAFVSFAVHQGRWQAVVASASRPRVVDLATAGEVAELVQRARADLDALAMPLLPPPLQLAVRGSLDAGLRRLDALLLAPLGVAGAALVVSCSSSLVVLPWSLLPSRRGLPVVVSPSASAWLRGRGSVRRPEPRVVAVAGPGLRRAEVEAAQVGSIWRDATLLTGDQATTEAVSGALATADVVHVAGHGTHQQDSPLFSSLRLADGPLFAYELDAEGGSAPCVVLSACEAGLATVRPGDEGIGLTHVLLHVGSRSVLAGVARVGDEVAARVMARVHARMAAGTDSAAALAEALAEDEQAAPFVTFGGSW